MLCQVTGHLIKKKEINENNDESEEAEQIMENMLKIIKNRVTRYFSGYRNYWNADNIHANSVHAATPLNGIIYKNFRKKLNEHISKTITENTSSTHPTLVSNKNVSSNTIAKNASSTHPSIVNYNNNNLKIIARNVSSIYPIHISNSTVLMTTTTRKERKNGNNIWKIIVRSGSSVHPIVINNNNVLKTVAKNVSSVQSTTHVNHFILKINAKEDNNSMLSTHFNNSTLIRMARNANLTHQTLANNSTNVTQYFHQTVESNLSRSDRSYRNRVQNHTELIELPYIILLVILTLLITTIIITGKFILILNIINPITKKNTLF